jgi:hypothetical protein
MADPHHYKKKWPEIRALYQQFKRSYWLEKGEFEDEQHILLAITTPLHVRVKALCALQGDHGNRAVSQASDKIASETVAILTEISELAIGR